MIYLRLNLTGFKNLLGLNNSDMIKIEKITENKKQFLALLLLADVKIRPNRF